MREQFKKLEPKEHAPAELKKEVFDSLETLKLIADVVDLFTAKFVVSETELTSMFGADFEDIRDVDKNLEEKK